MVPKNGGQNSVEFVIAKEDGHFSPTFSTIMLVRNKLGKGSPRDIGAHLKRWRAEQSGEAASAPEILPARIAQALAGFILYFVTAFLLHMEELQMAYDLVCSLKEKE